MYERYARKTQGGQTNEEQYPVARKDHKNRALMALPKHHNDPPKNTHDQPIKLSELQNAI